MRSIFYKPIFAAFMLLSLVLTQTGCDKTRTLNKLQDVVDEMRMHNGSILKVTNDQFVAGKVSKTFHAGVLSACEGFAAGLNAGDAAIVAARKVADSRSALDFARRVLDVQVFPAFLRVAEAVVDIPPDVKAQIEEYVAAIRLLFAALQALFADAQIAIGGRENYA